MSLNFGIYLVEQRIITPEQFCGLVKIQQEALPSLANVAIRKNMLTIKQVAMILDAQETQPEKSFTDIALENDLLDQQDVDQLMREQQQSALTIRQLLVECELLTQRQVDVLYKHYLRTGTQPLTGGIQRQDQRQSTAAPHRAAVPSGATTASTSPGQTQPTPSPIPVRGPKFKQRPIIVPSAPVGQ